LDLFEISNKSLYGKIEQKREGIMRKISNELAAKIKSLSDNEKIELVDSILMQLDKPDPEIDRIWAEEARKRWAAYKKGKAATVAYEEVMKKYCTR
jgi:putative addiction module component (TIGR02574 family)